VANGQRGHSIAEMSCAHILGGRNDSEQSKRALNCKDEVRSHAGREEWQRTVRQGTQSRTRGALTSWQEGMVANGQTGHSIANTRRAHSLEGRNDGEQSDRALNRSD
jgi:hypothetical protein